MNFKNVFLCLFSLFLLATVMSCNAKRITKTGQTEYLGTSEAGTLLLKSIGKGGNNGAAIENGEVRAFENLLFRGIPGTQYQLPMIQNEQEAKSSFSKYFKNLLTERGYQKFLLNTKILSPYDLFKKEVELSLKINVDALRRDMETNNIIRKFGI